MFISIKTNKKTAFLGPKKPRMFFYMLINFKNANILTFMNRKNFMLSSVEHEHFYNLGAWSLPVSAPGKLLALWMLPLSHPDVVNLGPDVQN